MLHKTSIHNYIKKHRIKLLVALVFFSYWWFSLPKVLFEDPLATVVESKQGELLGARIASDGQWRFPALDSMPRRFEQCILHFEDQYFYKHPGFNPVSMSKAFYENLTTDRRRGGSTLTQQVIRLSRKNKGRTYLEKAIELIKATRLEARFSKKEILNLYATYAPFGGNVIGLETAAWRYYGIPAHTLSWGQSATLAVLPNAPSVVLPGQREETLLRKRNQLLQKLWDNGVIDETTYALAILEPLPGKPVPLPQRAPHLTEAIKKTHAGQRIRTTIDEQVQEDLNRLASNYYHQFKQNEVYNLAMVVFDVTSKSVLGYVGNAPTDSEHQKDVDIIQRSRSTGSTLKPFLYAGMLDVGALLPNTLVRDIPTDINGYQPQNFDKTYVGMVPAGNALARSLNVPAVRMLRSYGLERFYTDLKQLQLGHLDYDASHYGLSLVLGGAESSLWELTKTYAGLAHTLNTFNRTSSEYPKQAFENYGYVQKEFAVDKSSVTLQADPSVLGAGAIYNTLETLRTVNRPQGEEYWRFYEGAQPIAWKTGTSFGFKDAWAVGVTPRYAIGVWVGNADGEGRPGITGIQAAAPLFFDVLRNLPNTGDWFEKPFDALIEVKTCMQSGHKAGAYCGETRQEWVPEAGKYTTICPYHKQLFVTKEGNYQVTTDCFEVDEMRAETALVLPPLSEYYYAQRHPEYQMPPPWHPDCQWDGDLPMDFVFPKEGQAIILPKNFDESVNDVIFKIAHRNTDTPVYWYLDDQYLGSTTTFHELAVVPEPGAYTLTAIDADGQEVRRSIVIETK